MSPGQEHVTGPVSPTTDAQRLACAAGGAVLELPADPAAVRSARAFVREHCRAAGVLAEDCDVVVLMTSELVTNAFLHGRSLARLTTSVMDATTDRRAMTVRVEVADDNSRHPVAPAPDHKALDGRGIAIVDLLATSWGVRDEPIGKTVWFELHTAVH